MLSGRHHVAPARNPLVVTWSPLPAKAPASMSAGNHESGFLLESYATRVPFLFLLKDLITRIMGGQFQCGTMTSQKGGVSGSYR